MRIFLSVVVLIASVAIVHKNCFIAKVRVVMSKTTMCLRICSSSLDSPLIVTLAFLREYQYMQTAITFSLFWLWLVWSIYNQSWCKQCSILCLSLSPSIRCPTQLLYKIFMIIIEYFRNLLLFRSVPTVRTHSFTHSFTRSLITNRSFIFQWDVSMFRWCLQIRLLIICTLQKRRHKIAMHKQDDLLTE